MAEKIITIPCDIGDYALMYTEEPKRVEAIKIKKDDIEILCADGYCISMKRHFPYWCNGFLSEEECEAYKTEMGETNE